MVHIPCQRWLPLKAEETENNQMALLVSIIAERVCTTKILDHNNHKQGIWVQSI